MLLVAPQNEDTMLLAGLLVTAGYSLSTVFDSATAMQMCSANVPDHAIIDLSTPDVDGAQLAEKLRSLEGTRPLRIVAIAERGEQRASTIDAQVARPATVTKLIDALARPRVVD